MVTKHAAPVVQFDHFYSYEEIDGFSRALADAFPDLCRLGSIGRSLEGREVHLLTLTDFTSGNPEERPGYVIHAGIHAHELASAHAALHIAQRLLEENTRHGIAWSRHLFYPSETINRRFGILFKNIDTRSQPHGLPQPRIQHYLSRRYKRRWANSQHAAGASRWRIRLGSCRSRDFSFCGNPTPPAPYYRTFPEGYIHDWDSSDRIRIAGFRRLPDTSS